MSRPDAQATFRSLIRTTAQRYRQAGLHAYFFALGKLRFDPVFLALLRNNPIPSGARVLDLGCGQGLLMTWLLAAAELHYTGHWPDEWRTPPRNLHLHGIERHHASATIAVQVLRALAFIETADLRDASLPPSDVVVLLDVLHYLNPTDQLALLQKIARRLVPSGRILLRVADASAHLMLTLAADRLGTLLRGQAWPEHHVRPLAEWQQLLAGLGFATTATPMSAGTPFNNTLIVAVRNDSAN